MKLNRFENLIFLILFTLIQFNSFGQMEAIEVVDKTIKIAGLDEVVFFHSFAEGDEMIFSFSEQNGKSLKEVEISKDGGSTRFSDFKVSDVNRKIIKIQHTGVFKFRLYNGAVGGRICSVRIERKPKSERTALFNTNWEWKTLFDTSFYLVNVDSIVGYDTTYRPFTKKELLTSDTLHFEKSKNERVHTRMNPDGDISVVSIDLPNQYSSDLEERTLIGWAYWFGTEGPPEVGALLTAAKFTTKVSPIAGLALGFWAINESVGGRNLNYGILNGIENVRLYYQKDANAKGFDWGDGSSSSSKMNSDWYPETFYLGFDNDHTYPVDVDIIVSVVMKLNKYHYVEYQEEIINPITTTFERKKMKVTETTYRAVVN